MSDDNLNRGMELIRDVIRAENAEMQAKRQTGYSREALREWLENNQREHHLESSSVLVACDGKLYAVKARAWGDPLMSSKKLVFEKEEVVDAENLVIGDQ